MARRYLPRVFMGVLLLAAIALTLVAVKVVPYTYDPLAIGSEALGVLSQPERVEVFGLQDLKLKTHAPGAVSLADGFWSSGPGHPLPRDLVEQARQAVLDRGHYDLNSTPDLFPFTPSRALRFTRGETFVDVVIDRDCSRDLISAAAHGPPGSAGKPSAGGTKLTPEGHDAFARLQSKLGPFAESAAHDAD